MKTVMVTGAGGFIGQHTVRALIERGFKVVALDSHRSSLVRLGQTITSPGADVTWACIDVRHEIELADVFKQTQPDAVIHLAAQSAVVTSWADRLADARTNIIGTVNIVEMCRRYNVERIVYAGSGGTVYGDPTSGSFTPHEEYPIRPQSPYGVSKMAGEFYVRMSGISHAVLRYPNVYGPGQSPDGAAGVVAIFAGNALLDRRCIIWGDGLNTRDYVFIDDVVAANIAALESDVDGVFNVGTGVGISVKEVYDTIAAAVGKSPGVEYRPARPGDVRHIALASEKAARELSWHAEVSFAEGVARTVEALTRGGQVASRGFHGAERVGSIPARATRKIT